MKITWVNHASFIIEHETIKLIADPWIEGTAFDNGWTHLSKSVMKYEDFADITHIWFSHEHPDHFCPQNLSKIPQEYRKRITVLFQSTTDRKVAAYCKKAGFGTVIEMEEDKYYSISEHVQCLCNSFFDGDSWLYIKTDTCKLLNINDCVVDSIMHAKAVKNKIGRVDILLTQFGYANKVGNIRDIEKRKSASQEKLKRIVIQNNVFQPAKIIPFASYVYFCHAENKYMNTGMNRIDYVYDHITANTKAEVVVMYPGEEWNPEAKHDSKTSISKYLNDYLKIEKDQIDYIGSADKVEYADLEAEAGNFKNKLLNYNKAYRLYKMLPSIRIWVTNYNRSFVFDLRNGLTEANYNTTECDLDLHSDALMYVFKQLWGGDTLQVNARFQVPVNGNYQRAKMYFDLAASINRGKINSLKDIVSQLLIISPAYKIYKNLK